ncbi:MAG: hypothetical protein U0V73_01270 [Acidimicrobiia bacterium]
MANPDEPSRDEGDDADDLVPGELDEQPREEAGEPVPDERPPGRGEGPYPEAMHYQFLTPRAPLAPGAAMRVYPPPLPPRRSSVPPQWAADPSGRHQWRWWSGDRWTRHVADDGEASTDPLS